MDERLQPASEFAMVRRRKGRLGRTLLAGLCVLGIAALFAGFIAFADSIPRDETAPPRAADGIVVLTGGASRIEDAVDLLAAGRGRRLLISGVHPQTSPGELRRRTPETERLYACCIDIDREAANTIGNAIAAARWAKERGFRSLIVVTSAWHMPRALVELAREMPGIALTPYPVVSDRLRDEPWWTNPQTARLLFVEYVKYVAARVRLGLDYRAPAASMLSQRGP
jgi:uncharacterized SAM-binding protein YcdF (DUF218 family)